MNEEQLLDLLKAIRKEIADQGRIVDARLIEKGRLEKHYKICGKNQIDLFKAPEKGLFFTPCLGITCAKSFLIRALRGSFM